MDDQPPVPPMDVFDSSYDPLPAADNNVFDAPLPPANDAPDLISIHPTPGQPEVLPNPEIEPITLINPETGSPTPPEGFRPGGIEGGF